MNLFERVELIGKKFYSVHTFNNDEDMIHEHVISHSDDTWIYFDAGSKILIDDYERTINNPYRYFGCNRFIFDKKRDAINTLLRELDKKYCDVEEEYDKLKLKKKILKSKIMFAEKMLYESI